MPGSEWRTEGADSKPITRKAGRPDTEFFEVDEDLPERLPGIDVQQVLRRLEGKGGLLKEILWDFARRHGETAKELREALDGDDTETAQRLAHAVKGVAANLSAKRLQTAASRLETAVRQSERQEWERRMGVFEDALLDVLQSIETLKRKPPQAPVQEGAGPQETLPEDWEAMKRFLKELADLLEKRSVRAVKLLDAFEPGLDLSSVRDEWSETKQYIRSYNFSEALRTLERMAKQLGVELR